ncbi:MAG: HepT-like ribonuclease domain-containing protein, partial [Alphaproteobacteria bacterium]
LEIVGEAARRISAELRAQHPHLPWKSMMGMRNVMIHEYDGVDLGVVWETVKKDLPDLVAEMERTLTAIKK